MKILVVAVTLLLLSCATVSPSAAILRSAEFERFIDRVQATLEQKLKDVPPKESGIQLCVAKLEAGENQKLVVKWTGAMPDEAARIVREVLEEAVATTRFSPELFAQMKQEKDFKCEFRYR